MKRVLLLFGKASVAAGRAYPEELVQAMNDVGKDAEVTGMMLEDLFFVLNPDQAEVLDTNGRSLTEYDVVYFRHCGNGNPHALAVARFCAMKSIPFVDREMLHAGSLSKLTQYMNLHEVKVPFPASIVGNSASLEAEYAKRGFVFPFIVKASTASRGRDNHLVHSVDELHAIFANDPDTTYVLQQFIPNDGDYRVLVMGDDVRMIIERKASGSSHLNNTSQGGSATIVPVESLPEEVRRMAVRAAQFYGEDIAGVDIVRSSTDGNYYCFEVNRAPQIERASFIGEKAAILVDYLVGIAR